ncbi:MAG: MmcQ/YjbR family DNA-binding protein [Polyangiaceae bacterium]|nr:MmcQ/YjbR family DNA-binding protein [Polyangiaceae bacterium]
MAKSKSATDPLLKELREFGLAYPGAHTKSPWPGHLDLAVKDKTFAYLSVEGEPFGISCKLPQSCSAALMLPFTSPTAYGLGKSGWVSAKFGGDEMPPIEMLKAWIDESYRAQAPKKLVAQLGAPLGEMEEVPMGFGAANATPKKGAAKKAAPKKAAAPKKPAAKKPAAKKAAPAKKVAAKKPAAKKPAAKKPAAKKPAAKKK